MEFGKLTSSRQIRRNGSLGNPVGEITLMIEWSWRIERPGSDIGGSWSSQQKWPAMLEKPKGASVIGVKISGSLPEIEVLLSNGLRVVSFMTAEGQPEWTILCRNELRSAIGVRRGRLHVEALA